MGELMYIIKSENDDTYWNNDDGWTDREWATIFTVEETTVFNLPIGGMWVKK